MPDDARGLIEGVYSHKAEDTIPESLLDASMDADGKNLMQQSMANLNVLKLNKGYTWSSGNWDKEVHTPTRLTEVESISVALAYVKAGEICPYAEGAHHEWAMSIVKIPEWEWEKAKQQISATMQKLIEDIKTEVKALRWLEVFPLTDETTSYYNARDGWQPEIGESL